jgi:4'-phosphopantetheinyl transferase
VILGRYVAVPPHRIAFTYNPQGKPAVAGGEGPSFNLSRSEDLALLAVRTSGRVGVDMESVGRNIDHAEIASAYFPADEVRAVMAATPADRPAVFFKFWTDHEAVLKAVGLGLSGLKTTRSGWSRAAGLVVTHFNAAPGFVAAVAIDATNDQRRVL